MCGPHRPRGTPPRARRRSVSRAARPKSTPMIGSWRPWAMNALCPAVAQRRLPARDGGDESGERQDPGRSRSLAVERERVAHHRPLGEAGEHRPLRADAGPRPELVVELAEQPHRAVERVGIRIADPRDHVPVISRAPPAAAAALGARRRAAAAPGRGRPRARAGRTHRCRGRGGGRAAPRARRPRDARDSAARRG